jgi:hypothetical protein
LQKENINMPSRINSTTTSPGGLIQTGDSDNSLLIQTGDTTAITVNSSQVVSLTNPLPVASGGTGASSNAAAPFALKGANSDITSLSGLTTALSVGQGGTGATTAAAAYNALNPMTTTGDIIYEASPTTAARLPIGSTGQILTVSGGIPAWTTPAGVTSVLGATGAVGTGGITAGTTYTVWTDAWRGISNTTNYPMLSTTASYADWRNATNDSMVVWDFGTLSTAVWANANSSVPPQAAWVAFNGGTYRLLFSQRTAGALITCTARVLVNGTQVYSIAASNTTANRSVDLTLAPFDVVVLQLARTAGASGTADVFNVQFQTSNGGLIMSRMGS